MRSLGPEARLPRGVSTLTHLEYEQGLTPRAASGTHRGHGRLLQRSAQAHRVPPGMQQRCELIMAEELSPKHVLLLLLSHFSRVRLCATPSTAAHQAPPSVDSPGKSTGVGAAATCVR